MASEALGSQRHLQWRINFVLLVGKAILMRVTSKGQVTILLAMREKPG